MSDDIEDDELTPEEIAAWRRFAFSGHCSWRLRGRAPLGVELRWLSRDHWCIRIDLIWVSLRMIYASFASYRRALLRLGPYRNA